VKPAPFEYLQAASWQHAASLLDMHGDDAKVLAGGQTLVPAMNFRLARPSVLIDLNAIEDADGVAVEKDELRIGGLTRHVRFEAPVCDGPLARLLPRISRHIAHAPIRMRGTFAGSLAHADPASEWCALSATLDATILVKGPTEDREITAGDFFLSVLTTALAADEVICEIRLPVLGGDWHCGFQEFSRRAGDFALALAITCIRLRNGSIDAARIGIGGAGAIPFRSTEAETALIGMAPTLAVFERAGEAAAASIRDAMEDQHATGTYRCDLVRALVPRALADAVSQSGQGA
jgi:aerobic carbon-monoxide dehydrogenase medium subunit